MVVQWLAVSPQSKKVLVTEVGLLTGVFLNEVFMFFLYLYGLAFYSPERRNRLL